MSYQEEFNFWLNDAYFDEDTKNELLAIRNDEKEIEDRFYKELEFGTGGLRGVIGAGTNRMNIYTVRKATQGLANYILKQGGKEKGVAIAYDSRRKSPEFADEAALCLAANGIKAYVFDALRPTPELSFALRKLGCISGIVITASHNPPEYNGYKAYWEDGAQVTAPKDKEIITEVKNVTDYHEVKTMDKEEAIKAGLYQVIGAEIDDAYMEELKKQIIHPEIIKEMADDIKIVSLLILELLRQGVALGGRFLQPGGAVAGNEGGGLGAALLGIAPGHVDDLFGLDLPRLHRIHKGVQLGPILQRVFALQRGQILLQLVDLGKGVVQVGHIAAQHRVPQAASGDVVVDTALRHNIVRADIVVKDTGILALLNGHQDNRRDDNDDRDDNCDAVTQDQALSDLHVFNHGFFPPKFS